MHHRLPIFHDEKTFRDRSDHMFRDMQSQMDQDFMRGFGRPLGSSRTWGSPSFGFGPSSPMADFDRDFFQLRPMHVPAPPSFPLTHTLEHTTFPAAPMEVLDSKTVDNLFMEDPENKSRLFQMSFDVKDYDPQAVQVRVEDNCLIVEAKQTEVKDGNTKVNKEFSRKIQLPGEVDPEKLTSTLSTDGVLSVKAPVPPRYHNIQGAPAPQNNTFTTTFKASPSPTTSFIQQQRQPVASATPSIHSDFHQFPSFSSLPTQLAPQQQSGGFYSVPVLASDNLALATRDRPVFSALNDGTNRLRLDLLLDLGRQYSADHIVVKFDERTRKLTVEATNEERDSTGKTSRCQISRQFELAEKVEPSTLQAIMKGDGLLHVTALTSM